MPYTTISTLATGDVLTATHLNTLSDNVEFLYGLGTGVNTGFNSYRKSGTSINSTSTVWYFRHRGKYLHWNVRCAADIDYVRVWYNGRKVAGNEDDAAADTTRSGVVNLEDPADGTTGTAYGVSNPRAWVNYRGAYSSGGTYDATNAGDGDIVYYSTNGNYYRCIQNNSSGAPKAPTDAAYWSQLTLPSANTWYICYVDLYANSSTTLTVNYLIESSSTSL